MKSLIVSAAVSLTVLAAPSLAQAQDAAAGKKVFKRCVACHTVEKDGRNKVGPNLWGIFGSTAGKRNVGYKYSPALLESVIVWDDANMSAYLENPRKAIPKTRMAFPGLKKAKQREDVIAYLKSVTQ
ncbi:MAG: cytochrome c family protein [Alphaproteobacteria bacterium]|nr:cytochrome c family protein [Alphaproteobacteria bacterium]